MLLAQRRYNRLDKYRLGGCMQLGAFSISLSVKDIHASLAFYQKLGFSILGGDITQNWLILKNGDCVIGLFQDMFEGNILTFNPGWNQEGKNLKTFTDIRHLWHQLSEMGLLPNPMDNNEAEGPASFTINDPDGNVILMDQHR